jgi:hypothetical protein
MARSPETPWSEFPQLDAAGFNAPVVYAAEFSNGVIKVGFSTGVSYRMRNVVAHARKLFGRDLRLVSVYVSPKQKTTTLARRAEFRVLHAMRDCGTPVQGAGEFFFGVSMVGLPEVIGDAIADARHTERLLARLDRERAKEEANKAVVGVELLGHASSLQAQYV